MNNQDKALRKSVIASGKTWRKYMRRPHETLVMAVLNNKEKQERGNNG